MFKASNKPCSSFFPPFDVLSFSDIVELGMFDNASSKARWWILEAKGSSSGALSRFRYDPECFTFALRLAADATLDLGEDQLLLAEWKKRIGHLQ